ncbi:hypothetical protein FOZ60_009728 [Perkinsus olseni]|uniref:Uncharacterized protein n=1 Tax=Perkinsus olseni TaxID=32597 RepID=A0A7J6NGW3_PEROL|nr:hypothetical protein FOZ60_009728 [Perkinsus olseni]
MVMDDLDDDISNEETLVTSGNSAISGTHEDTRQLSSHQGSATVDDEADAGHEENGVNNDEEEMVAPPEADDDDMIDPHTTEATPPTTSALERLRQLLGSSRRLTFGKFVVTAPCDGNLVIVVNDNYNGLARVLKVDDANPDDVVISVQPMETYREGPLVMVKDTDDYKELQSGIDEIIYVRPSSRSLTRTRGKELIGLLSRVEEAMADD